MIVEIASVTKDFGAARAVDELNLSVPPGICFGLLGPNGAGKTTTLRMIYGVTQPTSGSIHVFGMDIGRDARAVRSRLGVTLQQSVFIDALSPLENLRVFGRYHRLREPELSKRAEELIDFLELRSHANKPVKFLSGGFQRRLAIALSLINGPDLLILDEPTTGLDPAVRLALWGRVRDLRATGTTVLLTTHYMDEAERLCDRIAIMSRGKVIDEGSPAELIGRNVSKSVIELNASPAEEPTVLGAVAAQARRLRSGGRLMVYVDDPAPLVDRLTNRDGDRRSLVVRPSNLEDVFLALTGTRLEGQT